MKLDLYTYGLLCGLLASVSAAVYFGGQDVQKAIDIYHAKQQIEEARQRGQFADCYTNAEIDQRARLLGIDREALEEAHIMPF